MAVALAGYVLLGTASPVWLLGLLFFVQKQALGWQAHPGPARVFHLDHTVRAHVHEWPRHIPGLRSRRYS